jgi:hydroxymethylpyrimidine pyrophosphatase-like HAD family hydrolase
MEKHSQSMQVVLASAYWVDVTNKGANKGTAVRKIQERLGLSIEECAAFGDYMNDKEMLESVYYSYAMANAYPDIKDVARFEARSNAEHGVMVQIQEFIDQGLC